MCFLFLFLFPRKAVENNNHMWHIFLRRNGILYTMVKMNDPLLPTSPKMNLKTVMNLNKLQNIHTFINRHL